jgi:hypothetical protein
MKITRPYIIWWEKKGVAIPVVAAIVAHDSWQEEQCYDEGDVRF